VAIRPIVLLGAMALLSAGCGSKSSPPLTKAEYVKQMKVIGLGLGQSLNKFANASTPKAAGAALTAAQDDLRTAAKKLDDINPPENVQAAHQKLVDAVNEFADELDPIIQKLNNGNASAAQLVLTTKGFQALQAASNAIAKAGYPILSG
jgi:type VI protein secretion system component VasF